MDSKNKKGLSQVIGTLLMVLVAIALIAGLWSAIQTFVTEKTESAEACYGIFDKIALNNEYTCFNSTSNETYISISRGDIDVDSILVGVNYGNDSVLFTVEESAQTLTGIINYNGSLETQMPNKNAGKTYLIQRVDRPVSVNIAPKINNKQCDTSSSINNIAIC